MRTGTRSVVTRGAKLWRSIAGEGTTFERFMRRRLLKLDRKTEVTKVGSSTIHAQSNAMVIQATKSGPKKGIYMVGGCDLPPLFLASPKMAAALDSGTVAIDRPTAWLGSATSGQLLQTFDGVPMEVKREMSQRLKLSRNFFTGAFFEPTFTPSRLEEFGEFPKDLVVMSIGSDLVRSLHRHREYGFLVDLGGWWLNQSLEKAVKDMDTLKWFKSTFEQVGRVPLEDYVNNLESIVDRIHGEVGAKVLILNTLVVDPLKREHNFQLHNQEHVTRKREFNVALAELSAKKGFSIVDVDRTLKGYGVEEATDFAHFPVESKQPVADEAFRIMQELEIF